jgi:hypothetical protein
MPTVEGVEEKEPVRPPGNRGDATGDDAEEEEEERMGKEGKIVNSAARHSG